MESNLILWDEKFAIGIPLIDGEHKKLVSLCNELYKVVLNGNNSTDEERRKAVKVALKECVDYSKFHFRHEEELMELCIFDYAKFCEHKEEHRKFSKKILEEIQNFENESYISSYKFVRFLYDWILTHIAYCDRLYVPTLMEFIRQNPEIAQKDAGIIP